MATELGQRFSVGKLIFAFEAILILALKSAFKRRWAIPPLFKNRGFLALFFMIKKLLEPFGFTFGQLQDIASLLKHLNKNNVSLESFINYIEEKKLEKGKIDKEVKERFAQEKLKWEQKALKCPECNTPMILSPVNTNPRDQTGDDSKSVWTCPRCWHDEYSTKNVKDWW